MGTTLTGKNISASYLGLLKTTDNAVISSTAKRLTDGNGTDSPLFLSTSKLGIGVTPTEALTISSGNIQLSNDNKLQFGTSDVYIQGTTATDNIQIGLAGSTKLTLHQTNGLTLAQYGSGSITGTVTQRLGVTSSGQVVEIPIGGGAVDGSGTAGKIVKWSDSDTIGDSIMSETTSTITITGSSTSGNLQINGSSGSNNKIYGDNVGNLIYQADTENDGANSSHRWKIDGSEYMRLDSGGRLNVGITTSGGGVATFFGTGTGSEAKVQIEGEGGADPYINFLANNTQHWSIGIDDSDSDKFKIAKHSALGTNDYLTIDTSGNASFSSNVTAKKLIVDGASHSNVSQLALTRTDFSWGIFNETNLRFYVQGANTTTPNTQVLQIDTSGNIQFSGTTSDTTVLSLNTSDGSDTKQLSLAGGGADSDGRGARMRLYGNEHASNAGQVDLSTGNIAGCDMFLRAKDTMQLYTGGSERMRVTSDGNVGINVSNPAYRLTVDGRIQVENDIINIVDATPTVLFSVPGGGLDSIIKNDGSGNLIFGNGVNSANPTERMRITSTGEITLNASDGIRLSPQVSNLYSADGALSYYGTDNAVYLNGAGPNGHLRLNAAGSENGRNTIDIFGSSASPADTINFRTVAGDRARFDGSGVLQVGTTTSQTQARLNVRENGSSIEFGHTNTSDYYFGTLGSYGSNGNPFIAFSAMNEHNVNTWTTKSVAGNIIQGDGSGNLLFKQVTGTNTTGQTPVTRMTLDSSGNLGLGTSSPNSLLTLESASSPTVRIKDTTNNCEAFLYAQNSNAHVGTQSNHNFIIDTNNTTAITIDTSQNVGIGTSSPDVAGFPSSTLTIEGSSTNYGAFELGSASQTSADGRLGEIRFYNKESANPYGFASIRGLRGASAGDSHISFFTSSSNTGAEQLRITSGGTLLVGTTSGQSGIKFQVNGVSYFQGVNTTNGTAVFVADSNKGTAQSHIHYGSTGDWFIRPASNSGKVVIADNAGMLVGIGTASPLGKLEISSSNVISSVNGGADELVIQNNGYSGISILSNNANAGQILFGDNDASVRGQLQYWHSDDSMRFGTSATERMRLDSSGNLGLGTSSPNNNANRTTLTLNHATSGGVLAFAVNDSRKALLYTQDTTNNLIIQAESTQELIFNTSGANERMRITSGGTVSIPSGDRDNGGKGGALIVGGNVDSTGTTTNTRKIGLITSPSYDNTVGNVIMMANDSFDSINHNLYLGSIYTGYTSPKNIVFITADAVGGSGSEAMRIMGDNKIGIGTSSPNTQLHVNGASNTLIAKIESSSSTRTEFAIDNTSTNNVRLGLKSTPTGVIIDSTNHNGSSTQPIIFQVGASEKMRITSGGNVLVGKTTDDDNTTGARIANFGLLSASRAGNVAGIFNRSSSEGNIILFRQANTEVGTISVTSSATAYNTSSDYRLKEDLQDFNALEIASKIKMYDFKWKENDSRSYGVMAHELQEVVPQAVSGDKDAEDMQQVDYSKLVPILLKSIQELEARVKELEKEI